MNAPFTPWPNDLAERYRLAGYWTNSGFWQLLTERATDSSQRTAVIDAQRDITYAQLAKRARACAGGLHSRGIGPGDVVVLQALNDINYVVILFALFRLGAIPVCALPAHREAEIGYFIRHGQAKAYLHPGSPDHQRVATAVAHDVPLVATVAEAASLNDDETILPPIPGGADVALLQLSGGSTGIPKLIPRTYDDYLYNVRVASQVCEFDESTVYLCVLPTAHNFALSSPGILGTLYARGTVVMAPDPSADTVFSIIAKHGVTVTACVPALALLWMRAAETRGTKPQGLRVIQVGGARLDANDAQRVTPILGAKLQQVFGMAEGLVCYTRHDDPDDIVFNTQGRPASEADDVLVVDDEDQPVPDGVSGHLLTRGPYTIRGYFRADEHNETAFTADGYYRTGDLVKRLPTGHLTVTGRAKDQINRAGEKIAAAEIEEHLRSHPGVLDAALVGVPDPALGERSCAFCVITDSDITPKTVRSFLRKRGLAAYKIPDMVRFIDALPRTAVGKIDKLELKASLEP